MKAFLRTITIFLCALSIGIAQSSTEKPSKSSKAEQEILHIYKEWDRALATTDAPRLQQILSKDHTFTSEHGFVMNKDQVIAGITSGENVISSCLSTVTKVSFYGRTAVVSGIWKAEQKTKGNDTSGSFRFTDTWIKQRGRWQCVADHVSKLKAEK